MDHRRPPQLDQEVSLPMPPIFRLFFARLPVVLAGFTICLAEFPLLSPPALAQEAPSGSVWFQIEAQPKLDLAQTRADAYAETFSNVRGFALKSGWYAIVLGPYDEEGSSTLLASMKQERLVPRDSYVTSGSDFHASFWPQGDIADDSGPEAANRRPETLSSPVGAAPEASKSAASETLAESRAAETALFVEERQEIQAALQWSGIYDGAIDGAFGPATRASVMEWQTSQGEQPTGVLTGTQREALVSAYRQESAAYGFVPIEEKESAIGITLPLELVEFDRYEPPFVRYKARNGSGLGISLISEPGDQADFDSLYETLLALDAIPTGGIHEKSADEFMLGGQPDQSSTRAWARRQDGNIKGWILFSTPENTERDARIIDVLGRSFHSLGKEAMDPGLVPLDESVRRGLLEGLDPPLPRFSRSGFYIDDQGAVLTTSQAIADCGRITIDHIVAANITATDNESGLAVLTPTTPLSPPAVAGFGREAPRPGAAIAVSGYPYQGRLPSPVMTWGIFEEAGGLDGEAHLSRLTLSPREGDAGGPVVDETGSVIGMLLPQPDDPDRHLPDDVAFALNSAAIIPALERMGISPEYQDAPEPLRPEPLIRQATGISVLVSCWD